MKTIVVINFKGGVSKTTTATTLLGGLTKQGFKAIGIDLDPQTNFTFITGCKPADATVWETWKGQPAVLGAIQHTSFGDVIPGGDSLSLADRDPLFTTYKPGTGLAKVLEPVEKDYDYCIIDTPPALGMLTVNALAYADYALIPAQADVMSIQGIAKLLNTIARIKDQANKKLQTAGILLTRYTARNILSRDARDMLKEQANNNGTILFESTIREAIAIKEAQISQQCIFDYAPASNVAKDYDDFITEFLRTINS